MNKFEMIISSNADIDFNKHLDFIDKVSRKQVQKTLSQYTRKLKEIQRNPFSFPVFYKNYRKANFAKYYAILFEITGNKIYIDYIYDARKKEYNEIAINNQDS